MPYDEQWHKSYLEKIAVIITYFIGNPIYNGALAVQALILHILQFMRIFLWIIYVFEKH